MADDDLILAELLCARLVHDLSGPVGAVANGAELLDEGLEDGTAAMGEIAGEAVALLSASAAAAVARLRFLRLALGSQGAVPAPAELRRLAVDYFTKGATGGEAVALDWPTALDAHLASLPARLILNLLMVARDCLPRGGVIRLLPPAGGAVLAIAAEGPQATMGEAAKATLASGVSGLTARGAQGFLLRRLAHQIGMVLAFTPQRERVEIALKRE